MERVCEINKDGIFWREGDVVVMAISPTNGLSPKTYDLNFAIESITVSDPEAISRLLAMGIDGNKIHCLANR